MNKSPYTLFKGTREEITKYLEEVYSEGKIFLLINRYLYQLHYSENCGFSLHLLHTAEPGTNYYGRGRHQFVKADTANWLLGFELVKD